MKRHRWILIVGSIFVLLLSLLSSTNASATSDTTPPVLTGLTFTPSSVDTTNGPEVITVQVQATDDISGVTNVNVAVAAPSPSNDGIGWTAANPGSIDGVGAKSYDNAGTITFPQNAPSGTWQIWVQLIDAAGNVRQYSSSDLAAAGFQSTFSVTS